jgi:hypothetical protein
MSEIKIKVDTKGLDLIRKSLRMLRVYGKQEPSIITDDDLKDAKVLTRAIDIGLTKDQELPVESDDSKCIDGSNCDW